MGKQTRVRAALVASSFLAAGFLSSAAYAQQAAEPAAPVELPQLNVEASQKKKAAAKKPVKAQSAPQAAAVPQPAPASADPTGPGNANSSDKSPYGPVKNYLPKNTETGTKTDTPLKEIPQSISVVGAEQIRDMGAQTAQAALHYVPGVVAESYGNDGRTDGSFIRGTDAAEFLDGLKRTFDYYTYNYRIDPYFMERIEVLRGPASVLYGQAPVGGILNFVSKRPQKEQGGEITVEYGTFDFKQVKFDTTGLITSDGKWSYRLTGLARDADTQVDFVEDDRYAIQPAITFRPDSNTAITLLGHFQKDQTGSISQFFPHVGTIFPNADGKRISRNRYGGEPNDFYDTDVASGTLLIDHKFASWLRLQHSSRYTDLHNDYLGTYPDWSTYDPTAGTFNRIRGRMVTDTQIFNQDTNLEVKFATGALSHKVLGGVDYSDFKASQGSNYVYDLNSFNVYSPQYGQGLWYGDANCTGGPAYVTTSVNVQPCAATDTSAVQTGLYAQDQIRLGNWLGIVGLRQDWLETTTTQVKGQKDDALTYRAGLMYEFASGFTPYVSYGESFVPSVALTDPAKPPLVPQLGRMYEVGFKYQPVGAEFAINGAVYDISQNNRVVSDSTNPNYSVQIGPVAIKGLELELTGKVTQNLKVVGGYSYTQAEYTDGLAGDGSALDGNQIESIPKHLASLWGVWEFDQPYLKGWSVGGGARYIGESWDETNTLRVPDVTLFDAMIAYEEEHWRWQITGTNLEDKEYASTCLARGDCFLGTARSVITGLTYKY